MNRIRWYLAGSAMLIAGAVLGLSLAGEPEEPRVPVGVAGAWLDLPTPDVEFEKLDGDLVALSDLEGQIVLLNFWGTWCAPCRREIPELVELQDELMEGDAVVVGAAVESGTPEEILAFAEDFGINYPIWITSAQAALAGFDAYGYPFTLLIDRDGTIRKQYVGPQTKGVLSADISRLRERPRP